MRPWERVYAARLEDFSHLRAQGLSRDLAAVQLGVSVRTAERYEAALRKAAGIAPREPAAGWDAVLKAAHARRRWLREHGQEVPQIVADLDCQYRWEWRQRKAGRTDYVRRQHPNCITGEQAA